MHCPCWYIFGYKFCQNPVCFIVFFLKSCIKSPSHLHQPVWPAPTTNITALGASCQLPLPCDVPSFAPPTLSALVQHLFPLHFLVLSVPSSLSNPRSKSKSSGGKWANRYKCPVYLLPEVSSSVGLMSGLVLDVTTAPRDFPRATASVPPICPMFLHNLVSSSLKPLQVNTILSPSCGN